MVSAAQPQATHLSPADQHLLTAYIAYRFNLIHLANETKQPLLHLQDWALQPHIREQVRRYRSLEKLQHDTENADARSHGIAALLDVLDTTKDPIERRRAAQTLIKVGSAPSPAKPPHAPITDGDLEEYEQEDEDLDLDDADELEEQGAPPFAAPASPDAVLIEHQPPIAPGTPLADGKSTQAFPPHSPSLSHPADAECLNGASLHSGP